MGRIDINFRPAVPVFDANVALGRRHDRRVPVDTATGTIEEMDRVGVQRALVFSPHAAAYDAREGNQMLLDLAESQPRLVPQFCCNPTYDDLDSFAREVRTAGVRSIRLLPTLHNYPFEEWILEHWLNWASTERIPIWIPVMYETVLHPGRPIDASQLYHTLKARPDVVVVLSEVFWDNYSWVMPLLGRLKNVYIEISRFFIGDAVGRLMRTVGDQRILYGSRFPDSAMGPQLYNLHHNDLGRESLAAICSGNLDRLLGGLW